MESSGRFVLAIILMVAVIVVTNLLFPPAPPQPAEQVGPGVEAPATAPATPQQEAVAGEAAAGTEALAGITAEPAAPENVAADTIIVSSPLYRYALTTRGAALIGAELLRYESFTRDGAVELLPPDVAALLSYELRLDGGVVDLETLDFQVETPDTVALQEGDAARTIEFVHRTPQGVAIHIAYTFDPDNYLIDVSGRVEGLPAGTTPLLALDLAPTLAINEANAKEDERSLAFVVRSTRDGVRSVKLDDVDRERIEEGPLQWVALRNKYFLLATIRAEDERASDFGGLIARDIPGQEYAADLTATLPIGRDQTFDFRIYAGPQAYERLTAIGYDLGDVNPIGYKIFRPIIRPLAHLVTWAVVGLHRTLDIGYGWVLILFGVLVRLVLWPLNARAGRAQMKNMALQPRMQEIQQKYKDNPEKLQQEMLRLYREEGFNPFGGCLPMLIPFPVLITLFFVFQNTIEFRGVEFFWLPDLSRPDPYYILPILLGLSMFGMQRVTMRVAPANQQAKMLMYIMPAFMVLIFFNLASGLNLYFAAQNVAAIPQQLQLAKERQRHQEQRQQGRR